MGESFFSCASKTISCLNNVVYMIMFFRGLERFGQDNIVWIWGEVSWGFQQKWWACMHWEEAGKVDVESPRMIVKCIMIPRWWKYTMKTQSFWLIVAWENLTRALRLVDNRKIIILVLIFVIEFNTMALEQSEAQSLGHYTFYPKDKLRIYYSILWKFWSSYLSRVWILTSKKLGTLFNFKGIIIG